MGSSPGRVKAENIKLVLVASLLSIQHLKGNGKDLLSRNQDNMSEWSDMSTHKSVVSVCYHYKNPTRVGLVQIAYHHLIECNL